MQNKNIQLGYKLNNKCYNVYMEQNNFTGKNINENSINNAQKKLDNAQEHQAIENSNSYREPTEHEVLLISKSKEVVRKELSRLGVEARLDEYKIKFLDKNKGTGSYNSDSRIIEIDSKYKPDTILNTKYYLFRILSKLNPESKTISNFKTIIHEMIHAKSFHKYKIENNEVSSYRNGYLTKNDKGAYFRGLNEAITEKTVLDILNDENKKIKINLNILESKYRVELKIIENIVKKIAKKEGKEEKEIWDIFKEGHFSGNMMHLRKIEENFGEGSLRILAKMGSNEKLTSKENLLCYIYFSTNSIFIKKTILNKFKNE